jgi:hypothetical protein
MKALSITGKPSLGAALFLALGIAVAAAAPTHAAPDTQSKGKKWVTTNLVLPFPEFLFANDELIQFTGLVHLVIHAGPQDPVIPGNPIAPQDRVRIHTNLISVTGVGMTSGSQYRVIGAQQFGFSNPVPDTYEFLGSYSLFSRFGPQDPTIPGNPIRLWFRIVLNGDGTVFEAEVETQ